MYSNIRVFHSFEDYNDTCFQENFYPETTEVVTHPGIFHADEVFAIATLEHFIRMLSDGKSGVTVIRSRANRDIDLGKHVIDVGGVYSAPEDRYDHHQRDFDETRPLVAGENTAIRYASFGLVWREYGRDFMRYALEDRDAYSDAELQGLADEVDFRLVRYVDAVDNGQFDVVGAGFGISGVISGFNRPDEPGHDDFVQAVKLALCVLRNEVKRVVDAFLARRRLEHVMTSQSGPVLVLDEFAQTPGSLVPDRFKLVVFQDVSESWRVRTIIDAGAPRVNLPEAWAGLAPAELAALLDVTRDASLPFCHRGRFIAGTVTKDEALRVAALALAENG